MLYVFGYEIIIRRLKLIVELFKEIGNLLENEYKLVKWGSTYPGNKTKRLDFVKRFFAILYVRSSGRVGYLI